MTSARKERMYVAVIVVLLLVIAGMVYKFIVAGSTGPGGVDGRTAILLAPGERAFVLGEMRGFVVGLQRIDDALARDDMKGVAEASRALGMSKSGDAPPSILGKLPLDFKKLAFSVHGDFDAIADDAQRGGTPKHTLGQLSAVLQKCAGCHAEYQFGDTAAK